MQSAFCTNCGKPLDPGAAFCASCGTRVEGPPGASSPGPATFQSAPTYTPGYNTPAPYPPSGPSAYPPSGPSAPGAPAPFTPVGPSAPVAPPPSPKSRTKRLLAWLGGCLAITLVVIALLVISLIYGITSDHPTFFFIGLIGLVVIILVIMAVEHLIRRLIRRATGGFESLAGNVLGLPGVGVSAPRYRGARTYRSQPSFSPIRFLFTLALMAGALYGGLFLYYTQQFSGVWSGTLSIGGTTQGVQVQQFPLSLSIHFSGWPNITEVDFKQTTAQACKSGPSYQLSGTATMLDASKVAITMTINNQPVALTGTFQNGTMMLSGVNGQKQPVTLTLEKGSDQPDYIKACGSTRRG